MRTFGFILAILVGLACWALTLALSGGISPLGKPGPAEGIVFITPILLFALALAVVALVRAHSLTGVWIVALAPVLGAVNFALSLSLLMREPNTNGAVGEKPSTFALAWCVLLVVVLAAAAIGKRWHRAI
jgi:hypothetical protein